MGRVKAGAEQGGAGQGGADEQQIHTHSPNFRVFFVCKEQRKAGNTQRDWEREREENVCIFTVNQQAALEAAGVRVMSISFRLFHSCLIGQQTSRRRRRRRSCSRCWRRSCCAAALTFSGRHHSHLWTVRERAERREQAPLWYVCVPWKRAVTEREKEREQWQSECQCQGN